MVIVFFSLADFGSKDSKSKVSEPIVSKSNVSKSHSLIIQERIPPHENP